MAITHAEPTKCTGHFHIFSHGCLITVPFVSIGSVMNDGEKSRKHPTPPPHRHHHKPGKHDLGVHPRGFVERDVQLLGVFWTPRRALAGPERGYSRTAVYRSMSSPSISLNGSTHTHDVYQNHYFKQRGGCTTTHLYQWQSRTQNQRNAPDTFTFLVMVV